MGVNISSFIDDLVPEHIATSYPDLIEFIKVYALYLEMGNESASHLNHIDLHRDIDLIEDSLISELQIELGTAIPRRSQGAAIEGDPTIFYKHLIEFYRSRGTPESIKAFFNIIYGDNVEVYFPYEDVLIPSDGRWISNTQAVVDDHDWYFNGVDDEGNVYDNLASNPSYTYTISAATNVIDFSDDSNRLMELDDALVYAKGGSYGSKPVLISNETSINLELSGNSYYNILRFNDTLDVGTVITVFRLGFYSDNRGFTNDDIKVQDSHFWQRFSYVLKTGSNIDEWKSAFTRLIHPAGFIFFGEIFIFIQMLENDRDQPGLQFNIINNKILAFAAGVRNAAYTSVNELENMQDGWKEVVDANGNVSNSEYDSIYNIPDRTDPNYDHDRIPLFDVIRGHTIRANEVGTYVEKIVPYDITDNKMMRLDSSFSVNRWSNSSPMSDYSDKTIDDLINNSNSLYNSNPKQMGCKVNINTRDAAIDVADDIGVPDYIGEFITLDGGGNSSPVTSNVNLYHTWINNMQQVSNIPTENNI
mgnify:CR=1 FL=1